MSLTFKQIILWRHADAATADIEQGEDDMHRQLTTKGLIQAKKMAAWLNQQLSEQSILVSSPAERAIQTAEALKQKIIEENALRPSTNLQDVLKFLASLEAKNTAQIEAEIKPRKSLIIVGHQPWLGQLVTDLTGFSGAEISIKKGAIWWLRLSLNTPHKYQVFTVQTPALLKKTAH
ncbi:MAG: histidine phosphatase family protein [Methylotenera sp.]